MQILVSHRWTLDLGDIKGAFMEAGPLDPRYRLLFAHVPSGGIPGVPPDAVLEVTPECWWAERCPSCIVPHLRPRSIRGRVGSFSFWPMFVHVENKGPRINFGGGNGCSCGWHSCRRHGPPVSTVHRTIETQVSFSEVENWSSRFLWRLLQTRSYHQRDFDVPIFLCRAFQTSIICSKGSQSRQAFGPCPNPSVARHQWQPQLDCKSIQARSSSTDQPQSTMFSKPYHRSPQRSKQRHSTCQTT